MPHELTTANRHPDSSIRVYRAAPATIVASNTWEQMVFDTISPKVPVRDMALEAGRVVQHRPIDATITARVCVDNIVGLSRFLMRVVVERWNAQLITYADEESALLFADMVSQGHALLAVSSPYIGRYDRVRVDVRANGGNNIQLTVGDSGSWCEVRHV